MRVFVVGVVFILGEGGRGSVDKPKSEEESRDNEE